MPGVTSKAMQIRISILRNLMGAQIFGKFIKSPNILGKLDDDISNVLMLILLLVFFCFVFCFLVAFVLKSKIQK